MMDKGRQTLLKGAIVFASLSFPLGLLYFNSFDSSQILKSKLGFKKKVDLQSALSASEDELKELDLKILQARGEFLKFAEMRNNQVQELESIKQRLDKIIKAPLPLDARPTEKSQSRTNKAKSKAIKTL